MARLGDRGHADGTPGEPRPLQLGEGLATRDEGSQPRRIAEQLVPADAHEVGLPPPDVEAVGGQERGRVEQHPPAVLAGRADPRERVLDARVVRLGGIGEQGRRRRTRPGGCAPDLGVIEAQLRTRSGR